MKKKKLEDFSKETLIAYLKRKHFYNLAELEYVEKELKLDNNFKKYDEILEEIKKTPNNIENILKKMELHKKLDKLGKESDKLLGISK